MKLQISRIIIFAKDMERMAVFYGDSLGLPRAGGSVAEGYLEFDAGEIRIALHRGGSGETHRRPPKIVFHADEVAAAKELLAARGVKLGKVKLADGLHLCDGKDPEGNAFQLSNRPI